MSEENQSRTGSRSTRHPTLLRILVGVVAFVLIVLALWWFVRPTTVSERKDFVQTVAQIVGGAALLSGLYFTWRSLQVNREDQITERFTRAIDQLGATDDEKKPKLEIRLGGIYALERIARDSERDYPQIIDILTAYIRKNASWTPKASASNDDTEQPDEESLLADIQAILTVIGRRAHYFVETRDIKFIDLRTYHRAVQLIDLRNTDLRGGNLNDAHLEGAFLYEAHLERATLFGTHLEGATLYGAHLERARFHGAYLKEAWLGDAHLEGADLYGACLERAELIQAHIEGASLHSANLTGANLQGANLQGANLQGANLQGAKNLVQDQIEQAFGDDETTAPEGIERPKRWNARIDE